MKTVLDPPQSQADEVAAESAAMPSVGMNPTAGTQPSMVGQDPDKLFLAEAENLELVQHEWILEDVEERLLKTRF
jgi:ER membrane protein complex subunit 3